MPNTDFYFMKEKKPFKFSIRLKTIILSLVLAIFVTEIAVAYYAIMMSRRNNETFNNIANSISAAAAETVNVDDFKTVKDKVQPLVDDWKASHDGRVVLSTEEDEDKINEYLAHFAPLESDADFQTAFNSVRSFLRKIADSNEKNYVDCTYIGYVDKDGFSIYLVDSADEEDACPPGWADPIYDMNKEVLTKPERGFPAYRTNTSYGYLLTSGTTVKDKEGNILGYAYVDILLDAVRSRLANSIVRLSIYLFVTVALITAIVVVVVHFTFTKPVRKLATVANSFDGQDPEKSHEAFENLNINTHDEIAELAVAMKNVENAVRERITQLTEANNALRKAQEQTLKMTVLANRDSLTGVKSKTAYDSFVAFENERIIRNEARKFGLAMIDLNYLKDTNDNYGHDAGDAALIQLAHTICLVFKHSPVYRVGGDEFIVILKNEDFANHEALITEFKERIDSINSNQNLQTQERISAAIGYSELDQEKDKCVDDIFKRADKEMYTHKKKMKEAD